MYRELESDTDNTKKKTSLQLCKLYYDKAAKLLLSLEQTKEFLTLQLERVALSEYQARSMSIPFERVTTSRSFDFPLIIRHYIRMVFRRHDFQ